MSEKEATTTEDQVERLVRKNNFRMWVEKSKDKYVIGIGRLVRFECNGCVEIDPGMFVLTNETGNELLEFAKGKEGESAICCDYSNGLKLGKINFDVTASEVINELESLIFDS